MSESTATPEIEPELRDAPPRRVRVAKRAAMRFRVLWNALLAVLCFVTYFASCDIGDLNALRSNGRSVRAHVTDVRRAYDAPIAADVFPLRDVGYAEKPGTWIANGYLVENFYVDPERFVGQAIVVTYLPSNRTICREGRVDNRVVQKQIWHWIGVGALCSFPFAVILGFASSSLYSQRRRLRFGIASVATVVSRRVVEYPNQDDASAKPNYKLVYTYMLNSSGRCVFGEADVSKAQYAAATPGDRFTVLVSDTNERKSQAYFTFVDVYVEGAPRQSVV